MKKIILTVKCVGCGEKKEIGPQTEQPLCDKCYMPMIPYKVEAGKEG